jgi:hypothetical protein
MLWDLVRAFLCNAVWHGFAQQIVLLGELLVMLLIVVGKLGRGLGIPLLFWHEVKWKQLLAGLSVGLLISQILFVGFLLNTGSPSGYTEWTGPLNVLHDHVDKQGCALLALATLPVVFYEIAGWIVVAVVATAIAWRTWDKRLVQLVEHENSASNDEKKPDEKKPDDKKPDDKKPDDQCAAKCLDPIARWPLWLGVALSLVITGFALWGAVWLGDAVGKPQQLSYFQQLPAYHALAAVFVLLVGAFYVFVATDVWAGWSTPVLGLCVLLALINAVYGFLCCT